MLTTALVVGGVVYVGTKVHHKFSKKQPLTTLANILSVDVDKQHENEQESSLVWKDGYVNKIEEWIDRDFAISSASLGLAMIGTWVYPPFLLASVVALGYLTLETWQIAQKHTSLISLNVGNIVHIVCPCAIYIKNLLVGLIQVFYPFLGS